MLLVLGAAALIWGVGHIMGLPVQVRLLLLGLLYVAVLILLTVLPDASPLRFALGDPADWIALTALAAIVVFYRRLLSFLRGRVQPVDDTPTPPQGSFSEAELDRYARHITLREIGGPGQKALKTAKVLVVGAGGLGSPALLYLAAAGVGRIGVIDHDRVSLSNLQRQVIHSDDRIGMPKVFSAEGVLQDLNPFIEIRPYNRELTDRIAQDLFADYDLILDGTDDFATRQMVNAAAVATGRPLVSGAISQWEGQVTIYDPALGAPCLACVFPNPPAPGQAPSCAVAGVVGALPGVIGAQMAAEAIKLITGAGEPLRERMMIHDLLYGDVRIVRLQRAEDCPCCGDS